MGKTKKIKENPKPCWFCHSTSPCTCPEKEK